MKRETQKKIIKYILIVIFGASILFLGVRYLLPVCQMLSTEQGREWLAGQIERAGIFAPLVFILLMAVQVVIAVIPGGPLEITAGVLFGGWLGIFFTVIGVLSGTLMVYGLVRKFGRPIVHIFVSEEKMEKFSFLENEEKLEFWVFILFLIPGIPKDLLTYIVPLTKIEGKYFLLLSTLARLPALTASVLMGDSLSEGRYGLCLLIAVICAVAGFLGFWIKQHILREKRDSK